MVDNMDYINHFTLNSGHCRKSYPSEVESGTFFNFMPKLKECIESKGICEFIDDSYLMVTVEDNDSYTATVFTKFKGDYAPFFVTTGTSNPNKREYVVSNITQLNKICGIKHAILPPSAPLIIDAILPSAILKPNFMKMTGDFSRCLAWIILDKNSIIGYEKK